MYNSNRAEAEVDSMATRVGLHPFLAGLKRRQLALLTDCAISTTFRRGQLILRANQASNGFYLIETGKVTIFASLENGGQAVVEDLGPGELLGWSWMFPPYIWHFTAQAVTRASAIFFCGSLVREYCKRDPLLGFELLQRMNGVMTRRLQAAEKKMISLQSCESRIVSNVVPHRGLSLQIAAESGK
jgi:CRP-like cAMP-binding protein